MVPAAQAFFDPYIQYCIYVSSIDCIVPGIFSTWLSCGSHKLLMTQQTAWLLTLSHIILYITTCPLIPNMVQKTQKMLNKLLLSWIISLSSKALADVYMVPCLCLILYFFSYLITAKLINALELISIFEAGKDLDRSCSRGLDVYFILFPF